MAPKGVRDVHPETFIRAYAAHLKANDKIQLPAWVDIVKTAPFKEMSPYDPDWYYIRAAAIARKVYLRKDLGVGTMRKQFGGRKKSSGTLPEHFQRAAGGLIRHILKQLEDLQLVEKSTTLKGGRRITSQGQRDLDLIAGRIEVAEEEDEDIGAEEDAEN